MMRSSRPAASRIQQRNNLRGVALRAALHRMSSARRAHKRHASDLPASCDQWRDQRIIAVQPLRETCSSFGRSSRVRRAIACAWHTRRGAAMSGGAVAFSKDFCPFQSI
ncbi:putative UDP-3-O [Dorcoceras hygrometricum]|uniref:Putative UDP-3-O n=1 Tax=Dorcoceras hygrometricum TaxID=472368 RepID=A0A2Z7B3S1_9LAMI|nr:putative UDP-3-O [Dorcoceras hygrometricum]